jgi:hypothetical protein
LSTLQEQSPVESLSEHPQRNSHISRLQQLRTTRPRIVINDNHRQIEDQPEPDDDYYDEEQAYSDGEWDPHRGEYLPGQSSSDEDGDEDDLFSPTESMGLTLHTYDDKSDNNECPVCLHVYAAGD